MRKSDSGFTLIELLIVVTLLVILASMGMVQYQNSAVAMMNTLENSSWTSR